MTEKITLFWFRQDLRLSDNPGFYHAVQSGAVLPIYILDDSHDSCDAPMGAASRWWLHHSLASLNQSLGGKLNIYRGKPTTLILDICARHDSGAVYWNRCYEPVRVRDDAHIKTRCKDAGIEVKSFKASLLWEPWEVLKKDGIPYKVYTPFYRNGCLQAAVPRHLYPKPEHLTLIKDNAAVLIDDLGLLPNIKWYKQMDACWDIGEDAAQRRLQAFLENGLDGYKEGRNYPDKLNVSRLSPHLHFGEISPYQVWHSAKAEGMLQGVESDLDCFLSEIGWREFAYYLLYHFPTLPRENFQPKFDRFPWQFDADLLAAWQRGQTGYPIVDAGMRELWQTGYMHNRVRMIVGSFLVKNLLLHWHHGADWFWDCLVDADLANNSAGWQWIAGSGADAAPYFRIFNPTTQAEKFDPDGAYIRRFVPELAMLPTKYLFDPSTTPDHVLRAANIVLGQTYAKPIVTLTDSRAKALQAYQDAFMDLSENV